MTREELLNKELISIKDLESAYGLPYQSCARLMRAIKQFGDKLQIRGYIHVTDYINFFEAKSKYKKEV